MAKKQAFAWRLEAFGLRLAMGVFGLLPVDWASALGGRMARLIGPRLKPHKIAEQNLRLALPELDETRRRQILAGMWDNLGRVAAEYPHLQQIARDPRRITIEGEELADELAQDGIGAVLVSAHLGNWELLVVPAMDRGGQLYLFYRGANNPRSEAVIQALRRPIAGDAYLAKGQVGARGALSLLRAGEHIGMLVDQKLNRGVESPFFGRPAMTTPAPATLALAVGVPIVAAHVERLRGCHFRISLERVPLADSGDRDRDVVETTHSINRIIERWIRARPDLWFWVHRRWPRA